VAQNTSTCNRTHSNKATTRHVTPLLNNSLSPYTSIRHVTHFHGMSHICCHALKPPCGVAQHCSSHTLICTSPTKSLARDNAATNQKAMCELLTFLLYDLSRTLPYTTIMRSQTAHLQKRVALGGEDERCKVSIEHRCDPIHHTPQIRGARALVWLEQLHIGRHAVHLVERLAIAQ